MKKVFLLGDSIRMGYCAFVREMLAGKAEVYYSDDNDRFAGYTYIGIPQWKNLAGDPEAVNVVHWNNGHWDCAHFFGDSEPYSTVAEYAAWLRRVYDCIRRNFPNAKVIFATTTGIDPAQYAQMSSPRSNEEIAAYNRAAEKVMADLGVPVNDLAALASTFPAACYRDAVHFTDDGSRMLARAVADKVCEYL